MFCAFKLLRRNLGKRVHLLIEVQIQMEVGEDDAFHLLAPTARS